MITVSHRAARFVFVAFVLVLFVTTLIALHSVGVIDVYASQGTLYTLVSALGHNMELGIGTHVGMWLDQL